MSPYFPFHDPLLMDPPSYDSHTFSAVCDTSAHTATPRVEAASRASMKACSLVFVHDMAGEGLEAAHPFEDQPSGRAVKEAHRIEAQRAFLQNSQQPVLSLPDEILAAILELTASNFEVGMREPKWSELRAFLDSTSCVSRRWRMVVLGTPRLWRNILHPQTALKRYFPIRPCIERSRGVPLRVWAGNGLSLAHIISSISPPRSLQQLCIQYVSADEDLVRCLQTRQPVRVESVAMESCTALLHLPSQVPPPLLQHFSSARHVRILLSKFVADNVPNAIQCMITFHRLEDLELLQYSILDIQIVLSLLSAPRLKRLFVAVYGDQPQSTDDLFLQDAPGTLSTVLFLTVGGRMRSEHMLSMMCHTPNVRTFGVINTPTQVNDYHGPPYHQRDYDSLLTALHDHGNLTPLAHLRQIAFHRCSISLDGIHSLIDSRCARFPIQSVAFGKGSKATIIGSQSELDRLSAKVKVRTWVPPDINIAGWPR